jgi:hydroxymethylpyrimidine pyrophosphatase-like HAD family hydrolase
MRYHALACDYDGTIAPSWTSRRGHRGRARAAGRLGPQAAAGDGRKLDDLLKVLPQVELFDQVVAENGGLLYRPAD